MCMVWPAEWVGRVGQQWCRGGSCVQLSCGSTKVHLNCHCHHFSCHSVVQVACTQTISAFHRHCHRVMSFQRLIRKTKIPAESCPKSWIDMVELCTATFMHPSPQLGSLYFPASTHSTAAAADHTTDTQPEPGAHCHCYSHCYNMCMSFWWSLCAMCAHCMHWSHQEKKTVNLF